MTQATTSREAIYIEREVAAYDADPNGYTKALVLNDEARRLMREVVYGDLHYFKHQLPLDLARVARGEVAMGFRGL